MRNTTQAARARALAGTRIIVQTVVTLITSALGFVAALAWNQAIRATILAVFPGDSDVAGLFIYAIIATLLAIVVLAALARIAARVGGEAAITREVNAE